MGSARGGRTVREISRLPAIKDSLWSCDLFRCESASLRTHWVLVVMDQFSRRIIPTKTVAYYAVNIESE